MAGVQALAPATTRVKKLLALCLFFCGCAASPELYDFPEFNFVVIKADPTTVNHVCRERGQTLDSGAPVTNTTNIIGCWRPKERQIWLDWGRPEILLHELCHAAGKPSKVCGEQYHW